MSYSLKFLVVAPIAAFGLVACSAEEAVEIEQPAIVKERQDNLKKFGAAMKALGEELELESPSIENVAPHVANIATLSPDMVSWFPEGTSEGTEALPIIWEQPEDFAEKAAALAAASAKLQAAVDAGDLAALGEALGETGMSCKGCHDTYRLKDD